MLGQTDKKEIKIRIEHIDGNTVDQWTRVCLAQITVKPRFLPPPRCFGWELDESEKHAVDEKIFSALDIARSESAHIACFPELSFTHEWISRVKDGYPDLIVIGGSYYSDGYNICPVIMNGREYPVRKIHPSPNTEGKAEPGRGMNCGDEIVIFRTKFGSFAVLICLDYREEAHRILTSGDAGVRGIDFIFNPSLNEDIANFQQRANQDCQMGNYPYIIQVNGTGAGSCVVCMDHNVALERYRLEGYRARDDAVKYKLLQAEGEMMAIVDLDIGRKAVPVPATGLKMKMIGRYVYAGRGWERFIPGAGSHGQREDSAGVSPAAVSEGERKQATILCAGITGYAALSEKMDPEELASLMDEVYRLAGTGIRQYGGTPNAFTEDMVIALFGVPKAQEDAPRRAVSAALEVRKGIRSFNEKKGLPYPLDACIGISTGTVVTGGAVNGERQAPTVMGDAVNVARHLAGENRAGVIMVAESSHHIAEGYFDFTGPAMVQIRGKERPVGMYEVVGPRQAKGRISASMEKGLSPFVGRSRELGLLVAAAETAAAGRGQVVSVVGEAGIGKSRIIMEFIRSLPPEECAILSGDCIHFGDAIMYLPVVDILRAFFGIRENEDEAAAKGKMNERISGLNRDCAMLLPPLQEVMSLKVDDGEYAAQDPRLRKERIFESIRMLLVEESARKPLVLIVEDIHWIDRTSEEFLAYLIGGIANARVLLVLAYRPEYRPGWVHKTYYTQIPVNHLPDTMGVELIQANLAGAAVEPGLIDFILNKASGNPLFIEELTRNLLESGSICKSETGYVMSSNLGFAVLPDTIQGIIADRLDRLDEHAKRVIQTASVIGREFTFGILQKATGSAEQLKQSLNVLEDCELIYEKTALSGSEYIFKHALTREVAYNGLLLSARKEIHERVGAAYEQMYAGRLEESYALLAYHYYLSENYIKAAEYSKMAMRKADKAAAFSDAIAHARKRIDCLEKMPVAAEVRAKIIDTRTILGLYCSQLNHIFEAKEIIDPIFDETEKQGNKKRLGQLCVTMGTYECYINEDYESAIGFFEKAIELSGENNDVITTLLAHYWYGTTLSFMCEFDRAISNINRAINISSMFKNLWGTASLKASLSLFCHFQQGNIVQGLATACEAVQLSDKSGDSYSKGMAYIAYGASLWEKGLFGEAEGYLQKGIVFCKWADEAIWRAVARTCLGEIYYALHDYGKSEDYFMQAYRGFVDSRSFPSYARWARAGAMRARVLNGGSPADMKTLRDMLRINRPKILAGWISSYIAEMLLNGSKGDFSPAEEWIANAIREDRANGRKYHLGKDYVLYAKYFNMTGDRGRARENLEKGIDILNECGAVGWIDYYRSELQEPGRPRSDSR